MKDGRGSHVAGAGDAVFLAVPADPAVLPAAAVRLFVQITAQQHQQRQQVQAAEHADADHELLQLLLVPLVVLDHLTHTVQRHDASEQQREAGQHGDRQRSHHKPAERREIIETHETHAADAVSLHLLQRQQHHGERSGETPGHRVEPHRLLLDRLTAPLRPRGQKPGEGQNHPPHHSRRGEEIQQHEEQRADATLGSQHSRPHTARQTRLITGRLVTQQKTSEIDQRDDAVADGVEDDGPLRVAEALHVNEEG